MLNIAHGQSCIILREIYLMYCFERQIETQSSNTMMEMFLLDLNASYYYLIKVRGTIGKCILHT